MISCSYERHTGINCNVLTNADRGLYWSCHRRSCRRHWHGPCHGLDSASKSYIALLPLNTILILFFPLCYRCYFFFYNALSIDFVANLAISYMPHLLGAKNKNKKRREIYINPQLDTAQFLVWNGMDSFG